MHDDNSDNAGVDANDDGDDISTSKTYVTQPNNNDPNRVTNDLINVAETTLPNDMMPGRRRGGGSKNDNDDESLLLQNDDPNLIAYNEENVEFISLDKHGTKNPSYNVHDSATLNNKTQPRILVNVSIATDTGRGTQVHAIYQLHVEVPTESDFPIPIYVSPIPTPTPPTSYVDPPASLTLLSPPLNDIDDDVTDSPLLDDDTLTTSTVMNGDDAENDVYRDDDVITTSVTEVATPISFETTPPSPTINCSNHTIPYVLILEGERVYNAAQLFAHIKELTASATLIKLTQPNGFN